jgi:hypothetical protein
MLAAYLWCYHRYHLGCHSDDGNALLQAVQVWSLAKLPVKLELSSSLQACRQLVATGDVITGIADIWELGFTYLHVSYLYTIMYVQCHIFKKLSIFSMFSCTYENWGTFGRIWQQISPNMRCRVFLRVLRFSSLRKNQHF